MEGLSWLSCGRAEPSQGDRPLQELLSCFVAWRFLTLFDLPKLGKRESEPFWFEIIHGHNFLTRELESHRRLPAGPKTHQNASSIALLSQGTSFAFRPGYGGTLLLREIDNRYDKRGRVLTGDTPVLHW